jgi:hypothetical protein
VGHGGHGVSFFYRLAKKKGKRPRMQTYDDTVPTYPWFDFQQAHNAPLPPLPELYINRGGVNISDHNVYYGALALQTGCSDPYPWMQSTYSNGYILAAREVSVPQGLTSPATDTQHSLGYVCSCAALMVF